MNYIVIPDLEYTYEPHILAQELLKACKHINPQNTKNRELTVLFRTEVDEQFGSKHWWFFKDIKHKDQEFTAERISRLSNIPSDSLKTLGFNKFEATESKEIKGAHQQNLKYNIKYTVNFDSSEPIHLNLLIHNTDIKSFFEMAKHFSQSHNVEPLVFHNLYRINQSKFDRLKDAFETSLEFGLNTFFLPENRKVDSRLPYSKSKLEGFESLSKYSLYTIHHDES